MEFQNLFSPFAIGPLGLKNRILMAAMGNNLSHEDGTISKRAIAYYRERAKGGAGLIITEAIPVSPGGRHRPRSLCAYDDSFLPGLRQLVRAVHGHGSAIALQLHHAGRLADRKTIGISPVAPSAVPVASGVPSPREFKEEEIHEIVADFGLAARRARDAGFDAVEIHGGHGYLIHQFLSPRTNRRQDTYGGTSEKRLRFGLEVLKQVREEVGRSFPVLFRLSAREYLEGGYGLEEALDWVQELARTGASAIHVSGGSTESALATAHVIPPMAFPVAYHRPLAGAIKKKVRIPVIAVGRLESPEVMEQVLSEGDADLVAAGRPFLTDPRWPRKAATGESARIRPCVACNECISSLHEQKDLTCFQNAALAKEGQAEIGHAQKPKKIFVIGGGPGGLEAARVARERGHDVTLIEKGRHLGGQMLVASIPSYKKTLKKAIDWLVQEVEQSGVRIRLNREARAEEIENEKPDGVIVATGARPILPASFSSPNVLSAWDVLTGLETGKEVLIVGGGMVGIETAEYLFQKGCRVTVVEMLDQLAADMTGVLRALLLEHIKELPISVLLSTKVERVADGQILIKEGEREAWLRPETIVLAIGSESNQELLLSLNGKVSRLLAIGDCIKPRRAKEAIHEGFWAGLSL